MRQRRWRPERCKWRYRLDYCRVADTIHITSGNVGATVIVIPRPTSGGVHAEIAGVLLQLNVGRHRSLGLGQPGAEVVYFRVAVADCVPLVSQRAGRRLGHYHGLAVLAERHVQPVGQVENHGRRPFLGVRGRGQLAGQRPLIQRQLYVQAVARGGLVRQTADQLALPLDALVARARRQHVRRRLLLRHRRWRRRRRAVFRGTAVEHSTRGLARFGIWRTAKTCRVM